MSIRFAIALTLLAAFASAGWAKKNTVNVTGRESSGFNALDHVLQKPLGNPSFPEGNKGLWRNLYIGVNAGASFTDSWENVYPGYNFGAHLGGWFTPVHGIRLTGNFGKYSIRNSSSDMSFGSFRGDYVMNVSSLLRGYKPDRKFELLAAMGVMYQHMSYKGSGNNKFGGSASLQMRYNFTNSFYLFLEPEMSVLAGNKPNMGLQWSRMYTDFSFNVGLGYRILTGKQRLVGSTKFEQSPQDNIFYGLSGGLFTFNNPGSKMNSPTANLFMGKMFSSTSGVQLTGRFGHIKNGAPEGKTNFAAASVDYVLNLNNAFSGYRPNDVFQLILNAGPSVVKAQNTSKVYAGIHAGATGLFRLSHNWGIFVSPQVYSFPESFTQKIRMGNRPMLAVDLGVRYTVGDFSRRFKQASFTSQDSIQRWFFNAAVGGGMRFRLGQHPLLDAYVGVGRRFSPISSWRLNLDGVYMRNYGRLTAGIDYLSSITTAMMGYDEKRVFDLQAVGGLFVGGAKFSKSSLAPTFGAKGGFQANFRLTEKLGIYVEPQILAVYGPTPYDNRYWSPDARIQIGVKYNW